MRAVLLIASPQEGFRADPGTRSCQDLVSAARPPASTAQKVKVTRIESVTLRSGCTLLSERDGTDA